MIEEITPTGASSLGLSTENFEGVLADKYSADEQEVLRFWYFTARDRSLSLGQLEKITGVSTTVISRLFRGVYQADPGSVLAKLAKAKETFQAAADNPDFIETSLSKRLFSVFDKTRALKNVSIVWGKMGIGKTETIREYQRRNAHGRTQVVRFPAGASLAFFTAHLARACGLPVRSHAAFEMRSKIRRVLSAGQRLLIVDELHQAFLTTRTDTAVRCCEFLREIADDSGCGMVLVGTEALEESLFRGPHKEVLGQLVDRGTVQVGLPAKATKSDYRKFLAAYGLDFPNDRDPDAVAILGDIIQHFGLRKLTLHLRDGAAYAAKCGEPYQWRHFVSAFDAIQSLSR